MNQALNFFLVFLSVRFGLDFFFLLPLLILTEKRILSENSSIRTRQISDIIVVILKVLGRIFF